jgi:hypothetical protein
LSFENEGHAAESGEFLQQNIPTAFLVGEYGSQF